MITRNPLTRSKKQKALTLLQRDQPAMAIPLLEHVCRVDQHDAEAWFMLGTADQMTRRFAEAVECYSRVVALQPGNAEAHYFLGGAHHELNRTGVAITHLSEAVRLKPDFIEAHCDLGTLYELRGDYSRAADCFHTALCIDAQRPEIHYNLGNTLLQLGRFDQAERSYRQAIKYRPDFADAHNNLGNVLREIAKFDEAINCYRCALELNQRHADAAYNLGLVFDKMGKLDEATNWYRLALAANPNNSLAAYNLGNNLDQQGHPKEAIEAYRRSLAISPDYIEAHVNLAHALSRIGRLDEAIEIYRNVLESEPNHGRAHFNLSLVLLLRGQFRDGWREYQWQWQREGSEKRPFQLSSWDGSDLKGRDVFLHGEQGLGDQLFFLRFVDALKLRGAGQITYCTNHKLAPLLTRVLTLNHVATSEETPGPEEMIFSVGDLPWLLGMENNEQIPPPLPLIPLPEQLTVMRERLATLGEPPYICITWRAGTPDLKRALFKECPKATFAHALRTVRGTVVTLQRHPQPGEIESFAQALGRPVHDLSALNDDLESMLALLSLIDEYVGVSNTNMHLRAAVGKTAKVLVPAPPGVALDGGRKRIAVVPRVYRVPAGV